MAGRSPAGPPPPGGQPSGRYLSSHRTQNAPRLPSSVPANISAGSQHRSIIDSSGLAYPSVAMITASATPSVAGMSNPQIAEIQNRVAELVRRYDESVAALEQEEDRDDVEDTFGDKGPRAPTRWRVGDVLLATHRSLARTSTHTERTIVAEFGDDPEVSAAIGTGAQQMGDELKEATKLAASRHQRLSHIQQALHYVASNGLSVGDDDDDEDQVPSPSMRERQLRSTIDALHREMTSMTAQLQEAQRLNREASVATEQQTQELAKAQRALRAQSDELRLVHEANEKAAETSNALVASWRDKFQVSSKAAAAAEAKMQELEAKVRAQSEEIVKQTFVLQAKALELERFKENEAARSRAEAVALAEAEAEARRAQAKALEEKRKTKMSADDSNKDLREMEDRVSELESALEVAADAKKSLEVDNAELSQRMRELQARFGELRKWKPAREEVSKPTESTASTSVSTFSLRLREHTPRVVTRKRQRVVKQNPRPAPVAAPAQNDDDLSSSGSEGDSEPDEEIDEVERDEREVNRAMQNVVAMVFPAVLTPVQSESELNESIAQYEDPTRSPFSDIHPGSVDTSAVLSNDNMVSRSELDALRGMFENEINLLKQQYVEGLLEYKRLVIEQYGRRQAIEREHHRLEVEGLLRLIQTKFHAQLKRRSERLKRAKEALKVLYQSLRQYSSRNFELQSPDKNLQAPNSSSSQLRTLLRAAILTLSTSAKRSERGTSQIAAIHDQLKSLMPPPDTRTSAIAAAMTIHSAIHEEKPADNVPTEEVGCQTDPLPKDRSKSVVPGAQRLVPENLDDYVLPGSPCFPRPKPSPPKQQQQAIAIALHLVVGIPISPPLVAEMRRCLPRLPPGAYYVSSALRLALFTELVKFYATIELPPNPATKPATTKRGLEIEDQLQEAEFVIGSPRDTPFLRRKAVEAIESKSRQRNRRHFFSSGGSAILQAAFTSISTSPETSTPPNSR